MSFRGVHRSYDIAMSNEQHSNAHRVVKEKSYSLKVALCLSTFLNNLILSRNVSSEVLNLSLKLRHI